MRELEGHEHAAGEEPLESKLRQAVMNMKENLILTFGSTQSGRSSRSIISVMG